MGLGPILERHNAFQWDLATDAAVAAATATAACRSVCAYPKGHNKISEQVKVGHQVNAFEQPLSDNHQMCLTKPEGDKGL